jgi:predicted flap endonuclease-1-like 5' DNA nuclease
LFRSAATLALNAGLYDEAKKLAYLGMAANPYKQLADELNDVLVQALQKEAPAATKEYKLPDMKPSLVSEPNPFSANIPDGTDDLKVVEGIGPKIEELLNAVDIYSVEQLAATPVEELRQILNDAGSDYQLHDPSTWPYQAQLAANGNFDELKAFQHRFRNQK